MVSIGRTCLLRSSVYNGAVRETCAQRMGTDRRRHLWVDPHGSAGIDRIGGVLCDKRFDAFDHCVDIRRSVASALSSPRVFLSLLPQRQV